LPYLYGRPQGYALTDKPTAGVTLAVALLIWATARVRPYATVANLERSKSFSSVSFWLSNDFKSLNRNFCLIKFSNFKSITSSGNKISKFSISDFVIASLVVSVPEIS